MDISFVLQTPVTRRTGQLRPSKLLWKGKPPHSRLSSSRFENYRSNSALRKSPRSGLSPPSDDKHVIHASRVLWTGSYQHDNIKVLLFWVKSRPRSSKHRHIIIMLLTDNSYWLTVLFQVSQWQRIIHFFNDSIMSRTNTARQYLSKDSVHTSVFLLSTLCPKPEVIDRSAQQFVSRWLFEPLTYQG